MTSPPVIASVLLTVAPLLEGTFPSKRSRELASALSIVRQMTGNPSAVISHSPSGAPILEGFFISISHSHSHVAVALSVDSPVGIDIEPPSPRIARIIPRVLHPLEPQPLSPLRAWTAKEAVFKCAGEPDLLISQIRLNASATLAHVGSRRFAIAHPSPGLAIALPLPPENQIENPATQLP